MNEKLQTILALAIVLAAAVIVLYRALRGKRGGCGHGCGCSHISTVKKKSENHP